MKFFWLISFFVLGLTAWLAVAVLGWILVMTAVEALGLPLVLSGAVAILLSVCLWDNQKP